MFGWLKSLFGNEPEAERIVPPPLPSKVKKAEKIVSKKISKRAPKKEEPKVEATKAPRAPKKAKEVVKTEEVVPTPVPAEIEVKTTKKKGGRPKKTS